MNGKIGAGGCSHSSFGWGDPWHVFMGEDYDSEIISYSSSGAGNEMNIEKIKSILENNELDFLVCQLTEPARFVVGTTKEERNEGLHSSNIFQDLFYYTFNAHHNNNHLERLFGKEYDVDDFLLQNVITSDFNLNYKIFHTMLTIKQLCEIYNVEVYFFSWYVDLKKMAIKSNYTNIIDKLNIMDGVVMDFISERKLQPFDGHYDSEIHRVIYNDFIKPQLENLIKKNGKGI
jgi:hypothetical protein